MPEQINVKLVKQIDDSYKITIGKDLFSNISDRITSLVKSNTFVIISDSNVYPIYGEKIKNSLTEKGNKVLTVTFKAGEESKTRETKSQLEDELLKNKIGRDACIITLGGGVTGDMGGYVAATYQRGIPFVQIPTTLLSQVDSSIGGKVAVDTLFAKNMIGAFYQPKAVFIDISVLKSLPSHLRLNGIGEAIKHGIIFDEEYFSFIEKNVDKIKSLDEKTMTLLVKRSCEIKTVVVEKDEKESGLRQILNFGHTIGHAVETLSDYKILHDNCVCIGMNYESLIAYKIGRITKKEYDRIKNILKAFDLPFNIPENMKPVDIIAKTFLDKKVKNNKVKYVLPSKIGHADFGIEVSENDILKIF
jgi:3-dehydroquinate synthase